MKKIALFASGSGSNVENIARHISIKKEIEIQLVLTNNFNAGVIERCKKLHLPIIGFNKALFLNENLLLNHLISLELDLLVLAGFLWKIPSAYIEAFPNKIINIHPALLPNFGGKGMYGMNVHNAVKTSGVEETGITIHYVNENYDEGNIIFKAKTQVLQSDTPEDIAQKVHQLEYEHYPLIIEQLLRS